MPLRLLVIDASILFSFFKSDSVRRHIIEKLLNWDCKLVSADFVFGELLKNKEKIVKFADIDELEFVFAFSLLEREIKSIPESEYKRFLLKAREISPHTKDDPYFALALALHAPLWSDEEGFKKQLKVTIVSTKDLLKELHM